MATDVYVLNVGAGSCTVVNSPSGHRTMADVNDGSDQRSYEPELSDAPLTDPIAWFETHFGTHIFRFILSHADGDHMAGVRRLLLADFDIANFWDIPHHRTRTEADCLNKEAWWDWASYDAMRRGQSVDGVCWPRVISPMRGDSLDYWHDDGFRILSPTPALVADADKKDDYNDASYVLTFGHAGRRVMLASDIEETAWFDMIRAGIDLRANVLIASHHGRKSGYCGEAMELIAPEAVIVSTAKLKAKDDAINDHKKHTEYVFSTRVDGDTQIRMWDDGDVDIYDAAGTLLVRFSDQS